MQKSQVGETVVAILHDMKSLSRTNFKESGWLTGIKLCHGCTTLVFGNEHSVSALSSSLQSNNAVFSLYHFYLSISKFSLVLENRMYA